MLTRWKILVEWLTYRREARNESWVIEVGRDWSDELNLESLRTCEEQLVWIFAGFDEQIIIKLVKISQKFILSDFR